MKAQEEGDDESATPAPPRHDPYAALRHSGFRRLVFGSLLAKVGFEMQAVAVGWELYERTHDPLALGLVGLVQVVPVILLALPAGHAADRYSRKGIVLLTQAGLSAAALGLALTSALRGPVSLMYAWLALAGVAMAFANPARWAILPQLVPLKDFANAVTWRTSIWQISSVFGPALGGAVLAFCLKLPTGWPAWSRSPAPVYLLDAGLGILVIAMLSGMRPSPRKMVAAEPVTVRSLLAGVRFVLEKKLILATITLDMFAVLLGGATALLPIFAEDILRVGPVGFGWLRAAPSLGAVAMAMALAHRPPLRRAGQALLYSVAGFGAATIVFGLSKDVVLSFLVLGAAGALDNVSMVVRGTLVQVLTPDSMRGRVSAVNSVFIGMSNELGAFESGVTARWLGPVGSVILGGVGCILVVLGVGAAWPEVWRLGSLSDLKSLEPGPAARALAMGEEP